MSFLDEDKKIIEDAIIGEISAGETEYEKIAEAMRYSVVGGKMIRGAITLEFASMLGTEKELALPYAEALECIQAYSLIHDDLPCMDNDDMRRGKPSCHAAFGEAKAVLAGDALLTLAFSVIAKSEAAAKYPERAVKAVGILSENSGYKGMVGGQVLDLEAAEKEVSGDELILIHRLKTVALIKAAALLGCAAAGAEDELFSYAESFASEFGAAFQMVDDLLDYSEKPQESELNSYVKIFGREKTVADIYSAITKAGSALYKFDKLGYDTGIFASLLGFLIERTDNA